MTSSQKKARRPKKDPPAKKKPAAAKKISTTKKTKKSAAPKKASATTNPKKKPVTAKKTKKSAAPKKASATTNLKKKAAATKKAATRRPIPRADFGAPIEGFFAKQPAHLRAILEELRKLVEATVPDAASSIKWGMPFYTVDGTMMCALGGHKSHVNLILSGPPDAFADPEGRLSGEGKTGRHLKLTKLEELPRAAVRGWLHTAAELAREK